MRGLDIIGASPTLGIMNPYASLASGILKTAGGIADQFGGGSDAAPAAKPGEDPAALMKQMLAQQAAEAARAKAEAAQREATMYRNIAIGGGAALLIAIATGIVAFGKKGKS